MGAFLRENRSLLVIGLDNAGKTSILCRLANVVAANKGVIDRFGTMPTVGVQLVEFRRRNIRWAAWDMSGQGRYRDLWAPHASDVHGVIFVVDVTDGQRIAVARDELNGILRNRAFGDGDVPIAILANKVDAATTSQHFSLTVENVCIALGIDTLQIHHTINVFPTSARTGEGIDDAMAWLAKQSKGGR